MHENDVGLFLHFVLLSCHFYYFKINIYWQMSRSCPNEWTVIFQFIYESIKRHYFIIVNSYIVCYELYCEGNIYEINFFVWMSRKTLKNVYVRTLLLPTSGRLHTMLRLLCLYLTTCGIVNSGHAIPIFALCRSVSIFFRTEKSDRMSIPIQMFQRPIIAFISFLYISSVLFEADSTRSNEEFTHRFYSRT